ncbi:tRNA (adenosine(37)-N6)-threonylcarbamoyltransferase complex ATPase subunit type 1 TsaE [Dokdonella sp.]|uniref:tRNA (adenosine(37)-N6)-threonylcarbamoyltransferase complex ATPase subunit type 1 TsaE n=1 Tax=Dokdonella sp. TaxID=2291710 RepID=UPI002D066B8F|nr:tRNA (adenosine(37)-N6)-threonylcarbamoyltransferase complex ATPase subunit type 1 TsaE [Dokdonella sp.]HOX70376.1 tRNA (adenosine(37)-N6)-threonylcarbamoyltransferase complex ATPase subunit type 1 TsaE [Dokdonella sp.]HPN79815.1 tRNA (adenosine(37)-N6)-threonylcarbamoyltransferase complex ATPase subunit type 1 TsaE [Dokdonella sp.]
MKRIIEWKSVDESGLVDIARRFACVVKEGGVIFLGGDLGAGKTTFARALLVALGVGERVKSPTYSLVESYQVGGLSVHHLDLYRIADAEELEWLGLSDLLARTMLMLVEWPERGRGALPEADLVIQLEHAGERRDLSATAQSARGSAWLNDLAAERAGRHRDS